MNKPFYKKWWFILIAALIVIYGLSALTLLGDEEVVENDNKTEENKVEDKKEDKAAEKVEAPKSPEERIKSYINKEMGKETNTDKKRIVSIGYVAETFEVILNADENLTTNLTRTSISMDASEVFEELQKYDDVKGDVIVGFNLDLVDQYGNVEAEKVLSIRLTQETLDKINFENFNYENFSDIAEVYYVHQVIQ